MYFKRETAQLLKVDFNSSFKKHYYSWMQLDEYNFSKYLACFGLGSGRLELGEHLHSSLLFGRLLGVPCSSRRQLVHLATFATMQPLTL